MSPSPPGHPPPKSGLLHGLGEVLSFAAVGAEAVFDACVGWWPEFRRKPDTAAEGEADRFEDPTPPSPPP